MGVCEARRTHRFTCEFFKQLECSALLASNASNTQYWYQSTIP